MSEGADVLLDELIIHAEGVVTHPPGTVTVQITIPPDRAETPEMVSAFLAGLIPVGWMIEIRSH